MRLTAGARLPPSTLLVMTGGACSNNCLFCSARSMRRSPQRAFADLAAELAAGRSRHSRVEFIGGEFTLRPDAPLLVSLCRRLGYALVSIETNGRRFADKKFAAEMAAAGLGKATFSLHGARAATHDGLTASRGSFRQAVRGLRNAAAAGVPVSVNFVVTKLNFREIPAAAARFCAEDGVRNMRFSLVRPVEHFGRKKFLQLVPRFAEVWPFVERALRLDKVSLFSFPPCLFPAERIEDHREKLSIEKNFGAASEGRDCYSGIAGLMRKAPACRACRLRGVCQGVWASYLEHYGGGELAPAEAA